MQLPNILCDASGPLVVQNLNDSPTKPLGYLVPNKMENDPQCDVKIKAGRAKLHYPSTIDLIFSPERQKLEEEKFFKGKNGCTFLCMKKQYSL